MVRTPSYDKNGMKKGTWTPEEDKNLVAYVSRYGCWNWRQLPKFAGLKRCGKSCRLRWMNYLRPDIKRGNYTREEAETIMRLHQSMGNKWSSIAAQLPGRTDNEVKNYWHTHLKKRADRQLSSSDKESESPVTRHYSPTNHFEQQDDLDHRDSRPDSSLTPPILDTSSVCPYTLSDTASTSVVDKSLAAESSVNSATTKEVPIEAYYSEFRDDFWTEPFLADDSFVSSDFITSSTNTELLFPDFDVNDLLFKFNDGMNFLYKEQ